MRRIMYYEKEGTDRYHRILCLKCVAVSVYIQNVFFGHLV